jgi:antitoxin component of MazEF toxin-antitoxin module
MTQKIINIGNSAGITLNQQYLSQMGLSLGDQVTTEFYPETKKIIISLSKDKQGSITDKQVLSKLGNLKKRYGKLYQKLAQQSEETIS